MKSATPQQRFRIILILGLLTAIGPFSIDMYLPAFPAIANDLHTTIARVMLSLSSFFIGISAGQLLYGPLLERYGRKKPLYIGLSVYLVASIGCAFAQSIDTLIALRFLQALGGCAGMVTARAMVRDLFDVKDNAKIFSTLMLVVAVSPIIAPTVGGYVSAAFSWRVVFALLFVVNALILVSVFFLLPESKPANPDHSLKPVFIVKSFWSILADPKFYVFALTGAVASAGLYAYISGSPQVFMTIFHANEKEYGWIFAFIAIGVIGSSQLNTLVLRKHTSEWIVRRALASQSIVALILLLSVLMGWATLLSTVGLIFLFLCCQGFIFPNASALSLAAFGHNAGSASALLGAVQLSIGALASAAVSAFQQESALPMVAVMTVCPIIAFILFSFGHRLILRQPTKKSIEEEDVEMINSL